MKICSKCVCIGIVTVAEQVYSVHVCNGEHMKLTFIDDDKVISSSPLKRLRAVYGKPINWLEECYQKGFKLYIDQKVNAQHEVPLTA